MKKNKLFYLITILIFVLIAVAVFYSRQGTDSGFLQEEGLETGQTSQSASSDLGEDPSQESKSVSINFGQGRVISMTTNAGTAYEALQDIANKNNMSVETKEYQFGLMVESVDGKSNSKEAFWSYKVNDETAKIASDRYIIYPGDKVEWEYSN